MNTSVVVFVRTTQNGKRFKRFRNQDKHQLTKSVRRHEFIYIDTTFRERQTETIRKRIPVVTQAQKQAGEKKKKTKTSKNLTKVEPKTYANPCRGINPVEKTWCVLRVPSRVVSHAILEKHELPVSRTRIRRNVLLLLCLLFLLCLLLFYIIFFVKTL